MEKKYYTVKDAALATKVSVSTVYKWVRDGVLTAGKRADYPRAVKMIPAAEVEAIVRNFPKARMDAQVINSLRASMVRKSYVKRFPRDRKSGKRTHYSVSEAADMIGTSITTVNNWIKDGILTAGSQVGLSHSIKLIPAAEVNAIVKSYPGAADDMMVVDNLRENIAAESRRLKRLYKEKRAEVSALLRNTAQFSTYVSHLGDIVAEIFRLDGRPMTSREKELVLNLFRFEPVDEMAERLGLSRERIRQLYVSGVHILKKDIPFILADYERIKADNEAFAEEIQNLKEKNVLLRRQLETYVPEEKFLPQEDPSIKEALNKNIADCDFSVRVTNVLILLNVRKVADLAFLDESDLMKMRNMGKTSMREVKDFLCRNKLSFNMRSEAFLSRDFIKSVSRCKSSPFLSPKNDTYLMKRKYEIIKSLA